MLTDKVYLWLVIMWALAVLLAGVALAVAGTFAIIELVELQDQTFITGATNLFAS